MRDPRGEAAAQVAWRFAPDEVRVLEPSPPPVTTGPWFADDPTEGGTLLPVERAGAVTWQALCLERGDTSLITFCMERWLGPWRRLEPVPETFAATRLGMHTLAEHVLCPLRHRATGKIGLRWTLGGFGTPFLPAGEQLRVERDELVDGARRTPITTLAAAAEFAGIPVGAPAGLFTPTTVADPGADLGVERSAAGALGDWFGFTTSLLQQLRSDETGGAVGHVQLWPEHFDASVVLGAEGLEANFGGSPGDASHPEPYLYVGPFAPRAGPFWNEPFGASLPYSALVDRRDQRATALEFFRTGRAELG